MSKLNTSSVFYDDKHETENIIHPYGGKVFPMDVVGSLIIESPYNFLLYSNENNTHNNNIILRRFKNEDLNLKLELRFESLSKDIIFQLFCQFVICKIELSFDDSCIINNIHHKRSTEFCIFPLKEIHDYFYNIFDKKNINLIFPSSGLYICYFILVTPNMIQKIHLVPRYKYVVDNKLNKIQSKPFLIIIE